MYACMCVSVQYLSKTVCVHVLILDLFTLFIDVEFPILPVNIIRILL